MRVRIWIALGVGIAAVAAVPWGVHQLHHWLPPGRSLPGTYVGGRMQPEDQALEPWLEVRRAQLANRIAYLVLPDGEHIETTFGALGIELDTAATALGVRRHATEGSLLARLHRARQSRHGEVDLPMEWSFDSAKATETLRELAPRVAREPVNARIDLRRHRRIPAEPGQALDLATSIAAISSGDRAELATFAVRTRRVAPEVTLDELMAIDITQVLSSFETDYSGTGRGREANIRVAAKYLNGHAIEPGQTVSFNQLVGPRTLERGFTWAPEIIDDELTPGVGGGVCQVASTMHAAAIHGGLEVVRRRSHSRPSSYIKLGLDAMVIYGEVDLRIRNPYEHTLLVHAYVPASGILRIEFLGLPRPEKVEYRYGVIERHDFYRRVKTKPWMGERRSRKQRGNYGYDVVSTLRITNRDGEVKTHAYRSEYRPTPEVYWVGPEVDLSMLPDLPEGASEVRIDGEEVAEAGSEDPENPNADG